MLKITKPTLLLDKVKCLSNIKMMAEKARHNKVLLRPHFKTHVSAQIGEWFRDFGVDRITVSSVSMAEYFFEHGWDDITIAFPCNILEIEKINGLASKCTLNLLVESEYVTAFLSENLTSGLNILIKMDLGYRRTGLGPDQMAEVDRIIKVAENSDKLRFCGFLAHAGNTYKTGRKSEILVIHESSLEQMKHLKRIYSGRYPDLAYSVGDTPSCSIAESFEGATEIRPGNFVFFDLMQESLGSCNLDHIAVAMECPVVAIHKSRNEVVIYGGGVHFSKEYLNTEAGNVYGLPVEKKADGGWGEVIADTYLGSLSQEHGIVKTNNPDFIDNIKPGDTLQILPVHSCMTANLMGSYVLLDGEVAVRM